MKKQLLLLIVSGAFVACQQESAEGTQQSTEPRKVNISTRAASDLYKITYPVEIYVYNSAGTVVSHQTLNSEADNISLSLSPGAYSVAAISGSTDFSSGYSTNPLMIGNTNITVANVDVLLDVTMNYAVSSLDVNVLDVPYTATSVSVMVSPQYSTVTNFCEYSGATPVSIPCTKKEDGTWSTGKVYVLPGASDKTVISFDLTYPEGVSNYQITYSSPLMPATPYHFACSYSAKHSLSCSISTGTWNSDVTQSFQFGQETNSPETNTEEKEPVKPDNPVIEEELSKSDIPTIVVDAIPVQGTVWNGHAVAVVEGDKALLVSMKDWASMTSSLNAKTPNAAADALASYKESDLTGWSIPSEEQATKIMNAYADNAVLTAFNTAIKNGKGSALLKTDTSKANVRYLCEGGTRTFSFVTYTTTSAGASVATYHLRGVKEVKFKKQ